jgi:hypothetical protein
MASTGIASYKVYDGSALGTPVLTASDSTQKFPLGTIVKGADFSSAAYGEAEFRYTKFTGSTNIAAGDFVIFAAADNTCIPIAAASRGQIGIAMAAQALATATPTYGWVMVRGVHDAANVVTGGSAGNPLYTCATGARASTTAVSTQAIVPAFLRVQAAASNVGIVEIWWPSVVVSV